MSSSAQTQMKSLVEVWRRKWRGHPVPWPLVALYWADQSAMKPGLYLAIGPLLWQGRILSWEQTDE